MIKENIHIAIKSSIVIGFFSKIMARLKNVRMFIIAKEFVFFLGERLKTVYKNSILYTLVRPEENQKDFYSESIAFKISEKTASHVYERTRRYHEDSRIIKKGRDLVKFLKSISSRNVGIIIITAVLTNTSLKLIHNDPVNTLGFFLRIMIFSSGIFLCLSNSPFEDLLKTSYFFRRMQNRTEK